MLIYMLRGNLTIEPTKWGKLSAFFQVLAILGMLLQWAPSFYLWYFVLIFTIISGVDYILSGLKIMNGDS